ncbi:uncharacterized protein LOC133035076 [Cannabis sativa]|uniref:uncharacterized protein LOC133035076 n=1 Tax=Cannabis sativa TaxID=3483 RepID=UPI0029CA14FE|nr:uncharacterized protein LOC133035076 [Cannabis sativa]
MDLEDLLHSSSKKEKKRLTALETSSDINVEPLKRPRKTTANKKQASQTIDLEAPENQVQTHPPALTHTEEPIPKANQVAASSSQAPETLPIEVGNAGSEHCVQYDVACWRHLRSFLPNDWDLINNGSLNEMLERSVAFGLSVNFFILLTLLLSLTTLRNTFAFLFICFKQTFISFVGSGHDEATGERDPEADWSTQGRVQVMERGSDGDLSLK